MAWWLKRRPAIDAAMLEGLAKLYEKITDRELRRMEVEIQRMDRLERQRTSSRERMTKVWKERRAGKKPAPCPICADPLYHPTMAEFDAHMEHAALS